MTLLFSWKLAYENLYEYVTEPSEPVARNGIQISDAESLDSNPNRSSRVSALPVATSQEVIKPAKKLKTDFKKILMVIMIGLLYNCVAVLAHYLWGYKSTEDTTTYAIGNILFFLCFLAMFSVQTYVLIDGFVTYFKWRKLIIPSDEALTISDRDDSFKSEPQLRLEQIRQLLQPKTKEMNFIFAYLAVAGIVRFAVYCMIRFKNQNAFVNWEPIPEPYFVIIYLTELWISIGLFIFLFNQNSGKKPAQAEEI